MILPIKDQGSASTAPGHHHNNRVVRVMDFHQVRGKFFLYLKVSEKSGNVTFLLPLGDVISKNGHNSIEVLWLYFQRIHRAWSVKLVLVNEKSGNLYYPNGWQP